jgi:hypothetical protein
VITPLSRLQDAVCEGNCDMKKGEVGERISSLREKNNGKGERREMDYRFLGNTGLKVSEV